MRTNGIEGIKRTSTLSNKGGDVMAKCEGVTDGYTKYVQFIHSNNIGDDSWIRKMKPNQQRYYSSLKHLN